MGKAIDFDKPAMLSISRPPLNGAEGLNAYLTTAAGTGVELMLMFTLLAKIVCDRCNVSEAALIALVRDRDHIAQEVLGQNGVAFGVNLSGEEA